MRWNVPGQSAIFGLGNLAVNSRVGNRRLIFAGYCCAGLAFGILIAGCSPITRSRWLSEQQELSAPYNQIVLKKSLTIDALPKIRRYKSESGALLAKVETVSHSDRVVASLGQSTDGSSTWFNMVRFHEYQLNVIHKYFFDVVDRAGSLTGRSMRGLRFDCEMVLDKEMLNKTYASVNARRIAILRYVLDSTHKDIKELGDDVDVPDRYNEKLDVCGMLINQILELILAKLDSSPVLATKLSSPGGLDFDYISFGKGKVRMTIQDDTVAFAMCFGVYVHGGKYIWESTD